MSLFLNAVGPVSVQFSQKQQTRVLT